MALKKFRPYTPTRRHAALPDFSELTRGKPVKALTERKLKSGGRDNYGHISMRWIGGGHKQRYRLVDFRRKKDGVPARVASIEYDPNRSARIALLNYVDGERRYIIAPKGLKAGDTIVSGAQADIKPGNALPLRNIPIGTNIHCVEMRPGKGAQMARSAGAAVHLVAREGEYATLRLRSGEIRKVLADCRATIGEASNDENNLRHYGKAGAKRWRGIRPTVRGLAMNPGDHPRARGAPPQTGPRGTVPRLLPHGTPSPRRGGRSRCSVGNGACSAAPGRAHPAGATRKAPGVPQGAPARAWNAPRAWPTTQTRGGTKP